MQDSEVRDKMLKKETVSCTHYRLDMDPSAPFGQCICGRCASCRARRISDMISANMAYDLGDGTR